VDTADLRRFLRRLANALRPARAERELTREVESHLTNLSDELSRRRGLPSDEARLAARRAFGGVEQAKELQRTERSFRWIDETRQDLAYAVRALRRAPGFTLVSFFTLTLGIGATTAIFSIVHGVLLTPLPYERADRLVRLVSLPPAEATPTRVPQGTPPPRTRAFRSGDMTVAELREAAARVPGLTRAALTGGPSIMTMSGRGEATRLQGMGLSAGVFDILGVRPVVGRGFEPADEGADVVVLSYATWQRYFQSDPGIIGQTLGLSESLLPGLARAPKTFTVVGVMPRGFAFSDAQVQFWIPMGWTPQSRGQLVARLADDVTLEAAAAQLGALVRPMRPGAQPAEWRLEPMQHAIVAPVKPALVVLAGAVAFVLLIACVNVANLLLARTATREREMAIRLAIGAGRGRLVRQLLTESVVLALLGGVGGALFAWVGVRGLRSLATTMLRMDLGNNLQFPRLDDIGVDPTVLAFTLAVSVGAGLLFGLAPALRSARPTQMDALRATVGTSAALGFFRPQRLRHALVLVQVVAAFVLLVGGGLLMHSFLKLSSVDTGYDADRVLTFQVALPPARYPATSFAPFADALVARLRTAPGVRAAAFAQQLPTVAMRDSFRMTRLGAPPPSPSAPPPFADQRLVSREYLDTMGIRVIAGRSFRDGDRAGTPPVVLINEVLARREFGGESPIGQRVQIGDHVREVVGVVADVRQMGPELEPSPQYFIDFRQWLEPRVFPLGPYYAVRTAGDPLDLVAHVRNVARQLDAEAGLYNVATLEALNANRLTRPRLYTVLLGSFALAGLVLACVGLYGVMAYAVTERTREIGIRMALGAQRRDVLRMVLGQGLAVVATGLAVGVAGAVLATRVLKTLLYELTPLDPSTFAAVAALFATAATIASWIPARRATTIDPLLAIREE
jgi:putative ABC transport system permease protein